MDDHDLFVERRKSIRLKAIDNTVAVWRRGSRFGFGSVLDVSQGGLGLGTFDPEVGLEEEDKVEIYIANTAVGFQLDKLVATLVSEPEPEGGGSGSSALLKYGFQFNGISPFQKTELLRFIREYTNLDSFWNTYQNEG